MTAEAEHEFCCVMGV